MPEFQAGLGAVNLRFYLNQNFCDSFGGCSNSNIFLESSNHFQLHLAGGVRFYVKGGIFVRPQIDGHWVNNFFQFGSNWVPAIQHGGWIYVRGKPLSRLDCLLSANRKRRSRLTEGAVSFGLLRHLGSGSSAFSALRTRSGVRGTSRKPHSNGVEDSVCDCGRNRNDRRLTAAERLHFLAIDENHVHIGNILIANDRISDPIEVLHSRSIELNLFEQRPADALNHVPLNLIGQAIGIHDEPAIVRKRNPLHNHFSRSLINFHFSYRSGNGVGAIRHRYSPPDGFRSVSICVAGEGRSCQSGFLRCGQKNVGRAHIAGKILEPEFHRIDAESGRNFVYE